MAVTVASSTVRAWGSDADSENITLPASTATGDILVLLAASSGNLSDELAWSGSTKLGSTVVYDSVVELDYFYKVATATDISNGYITVTTSGSYTRQVKYVLLRVTGGSTSGIQWKGDDATASANPTYTDLATTPTVANSLFIAQVAVDNGSRTYSAYAFETSSPTWTEVTDTAEGSGASEAVAWAVRPETTSTGYFTFTISASAESGAGLICIPPSVAVESVATTAFNSVGEGEYLTITKPTGLTVGDLLFAHLSVVQSDSGGGGFENKSGWTTLIGESKHTNLNSTASTKVMYKTAEAADVAASDFTFQKDSTSADACGGALIRVAAGSAPYAQVGTDSDDTTPEFTNTVTPTIASSLLLFLTTVADATQASGTCSSYAVTTSNPTWTEQYDFSANLFGCRGLMAGASAIRPETTATGDSTCTYSNHSQNSIGVIILVNPVGSAIFNATQLELTSSIQAPSVTGGAIPATPSVLALTSSIPTPTVTTPTPKYTNTNKSSTSTFTNTTKS